MSIPLCLSGESGQSRKHWKPRTSARMNALRAVEPRCLAVGITRAVSGCPKSCVTRADVQKSRQVVRPGQKDKHGEKGHQAGAGLRDDERQYRRTGNGARTTYLGTVAEIPEGQNPRRTGKLPFPHDDARHEDGKDGERRNDGSAMPRVLDAAPLQSEDEASDAADHDRRADPVERKEAEGESRARRAPATERPSSEFPLCVDSDLLEHGRRRLRAELKVHNYQPRGGVSERGKRSDGR